MRKAIRTHDGADGIHTYIRRISLESRVVFSSLEHPLFAMLTPGWLWPSKKQVIMRSVFSLLFPLSPVCIHHCCGLMNCGDVAADLAPMMPPECSQNKQDRYGILRSVINVAFPVCNRRAPGAQPRLPEPVDQPA